LKIALVHDWLVTYAGSERVLEQILLLYPEADLFSLIDFIPAENRGFLLNKKVKTSFLQTMPFARSKYRSFLPLMPCAIESFNFAGYDLVISSSHAIAKGIKPKNALHICYCHTPMRYLWDLSQQYLESLGPKWSAKRLLARAVLSTIKQWDLKTAKRVDYFIANSNYIAGRIKRVYHRDSTVIYPPVDTNKFGLDIDKKDFYLTVSRMVPYKKIDIIVDAFSRMPDKKLFVIGDGPDLNKILAKGAKNIEFMRHQPDQVLKYYLRKAKAFVFMAEEDFGITIVEAQACGTPVIAFGKGGASETIINNETGILFPRQTAEDLIAAVVDFEALENKFNYLRIRDHAQKFNIQIFKTEFKNFVDGKI